MTSDIQYTPSDVTHDSQRRAESDNIWLGAELFLKRKAQLLGVRVVVKPRTNFYLRRRQWFAIQYLLYDVTSQLSHPIED